jgi:hypothetical protein
MDRLKMIGVAARAIQKVDALNLDGTEHRDRAWPDPARQEVGLAAVIVDALIVSGALRSFRRREREPEGGTMPPGPWSGSG